MFPHRGAGDAPWEPPTTGGPWDPPLTEAVPHAAFVNGGNRKQGAHSTHSVEASC